MVRGPESIFTNYKIQKIYAKPDLSHIMLPYGGDGIEMLVTMPNIFDHTTVNEVFYPPNMYYQKFTQRLSPQIIKWYKPKADEMDEDHEDGPDQKKQKTCNFTVNN